MDLYKVSDSHDCHDIVVGLDIRLMSELAMEQLYIWQTAVSVSLQIFLLQELSLWTMAPLWT